MYQITYNALANPLPEQGVWKLTCISYVYLSYLVMVGLVTGAIKNIYINTE